MRSARSSTGESGWRSSVDDEAIYVEQLLSGIETRVEGLVEEANLEREEARSALHKTARVGGLLYVLLILAAWWWSARTTIAPIRRLARSAEIAAEKDERLEVVERVQPHLAAIEVQLLFGNSAR